MNNLRKYLSLFFLQVDRIVCHRLYKGREEFLVYWKGFENSTATWEPVENLLSCGDLIEQFHRQAIQIPGELNTERFSID